MTMDVYPEVLERVKGGAKFLDLGCCLGQEIHQLVLDGAPSANTYGCDMYGGFFPAGHELFHDGNGKLQTTFIEADAFDASPGSPLAALASQIDIVYTGAFFHLFGLAEQEQLAASVARILAPRAGSLIIGRQTGSEEAGEFSRGGDTSGHTRFRHSPQSWKELWDRVGAATATAWRVEADLSQPEYTRWRRPAWRQPSCRPR